MEFIMTVLAVTLGTVLGGIVLTTTYFVVLGSKWGTKLIAKWTERYIKNISEVGEEIEIES